METNYFVIAYYLGLIVLVGNFLVMQRAVRSYSEMKAIERRVINILRMRKRGR
jgi:hypothetical protein